MGKKEREKKEKNQEKKYSIGCVRNRSVFFSLFLDPDLLLVRFFAVCPFLFLFTSRNDANAALRFDRFFLFFSTKSRVEKREATAGNDDDKKEEKTRDVKKREDLSPCPPQVSLPPHGPGRLLLRSFFMDNNNEFGSRKKGKSAAISLFSLQRKSNEEKETHTKKLNFN